MSVIQSVGSGVVVCDIFFHGHCYYPLEQHHSRVLLLTISVSLRPQRTHRLMIASTSSLKRVSWS